MADQLPIYDATLACHRALQTCSRLGAEGIQNEWAENCLADFNLWAKGAGALKLGNASFDSRLSSNPEAKTFVVNLLIMLQGFVGKCSEIESEVQSNTVETSKLSQAVQDVKDILKQLSRITIAIRRAGTNARTQKVDASYDPDHPQIEALSQHLQLLLLVKPSRNGTPKARVSEYSQSMLLYSCEGGATVIDSRSLTPIQQRLVEANLKRRNRFLYFQRHAVKFSERDHVLSSSVTAPPQLPLPPALSGFEQTTAGDEVPKLLSTATTTEVQETIKLPMQESAQPATTVISAVSSRVTYPRPPPLRSDQNVFQCPCCCQTLPKSMSRESQWKKHLSRDVRPYVCILEECSHPERLYHTKDLWMSHMFTDHGGRSKWVCLACNDSGTGNRPEFFEESTFVDHLEEKHSRGIKPQQIDMLIHAWQRKVSVSIHSCPLCGFEDPNSDAVLNHTAEHLHSFSLRSLPWAKDENESSGGQYDSYFEENPYFDTGGSVNTGSERSRSTISSQQRDELPAASPVEETTESNQLTEDKLRNMVTSPNVERDMLDSFLNDIETQKFSQEPSQLATVSEPGPSDSGQGKSGKELMCLRVLAEREKALGPDHPSTLDAVSNLGILYSNQGKLKEAVDLLERVVAVRDRTLKEEHPDRLTSHLELARAYKSNGQIKQAVELLDHMLTVQKRTLTEEHPDRLKLQYRLAKAYKFMGQLKQAVELLEHVVAVRKRTLAEEHPDQLKSQYRLARAYKSTGQLKQAVELLEYVVAVRKRTLGEKHHKQLVSQIELARAYKSNGQIKQAVELLEHVVAVYKRTLSEEHPDLLASQCHLAQAYRSNGQINQAVELFEHVVAGYKRALAEEHPHLLTSQNELARAYKSIKQTKQAVELLEHVVAVRNRTLGEEHPHLLTSQIELARAYKSDGQIKQAVDLFEYVVAVRKRTLIEEHHDLLASQRKLAQAYHSNGQINKAVELCEHMVAVCERTLNEGHPDLLASQGALEHAKGLLEIEVLKNRVLEH